MNDLWDKHWAYRDSKGEQMIQTISAVSFSAKPKDFKGDVSGIVTGVKPPSKEGKVIVYIRLDGMSKDIGVTGKMTFDDVMGKPVVMTRCAVS